VSRRALPLLALFVAVAGCADRPAVPYARLAEPEIAQGAIVTPAGDRLALSHWPADGETRAVILALHGFGDTGPQTFGAAAAAWSARGIATYAPDQRGFGLNPSRQRWPGADMLIDDAVAIAAELRGLYPGVPLVVVGHSMGGGVALAAAGRGLDANALVLAGPAIVGGAALNPALRAGGWAAATVVPDRRWTGGELVQITPTDNRDALRDAARDPGRFDDPSSRELYGLVRVMDRAAAAAPSVTLPTLTLMGARDEVLRPAQVRAVHATIPGGVAYVEYPEGWHWLFRDRQADRVWQDVADFVLSAGR
jgi:alpha-beta hydrolase superfamily lysophospholipase